LASAAAPFPGDADVSNPRAPDPQDRSITGGVEIFRGHLGDGWFRATDLWTSSTAPPSEIGGSGSFSVRGLSPGLVLVYQIHDQAGKATDEWIGAKFYSPRNQFKTNASECTVYRGNPTTPSSHKAQATPYQCRWEGTTGYNPSPELVVEAAGAEFPGDAKLTNPMAADPQGDRHVFADMRLRVPSLRDGWFRATDVWSSATSPPGAVFKGQAGGLLVTGTAPGFALLYQIYDEAGKPTGYRLGAKFYSPLLGFTNDAKCTIYQGDPMTAGQPVRNSPYVCEWGGIVGNTPIKPTLYVSPRK
jgi:hypothetical protein